MPSNMAITSYAHCYYALLLAKLFNAGISNADGEINACFNFAEHLAYAVYSHRQAGMAGEFDFDEFVIQYRGHFNITDAVVNRLRQPQIGIIDSKGTFTTEYIYYFMLGKYLAEHLAECADIVEYLCNNSHSEDMYLTLLFIIHHTDDSAVVDDILMNTLMILEQVEAATLSSADTHRFSDLLARLPETMLSQDPVSTNRNQILDTHDQLAALGNDDLRTNGPDVLDSAVESALAEIYRAFKNSRILGQVLRTTTWQFGNQEDRRYRRNRGRPWPSPYSEVNA